MTSVARAFHAGAVLFGKAHGKLLDLRDLIGALHDVLPEEHQLKGKDKKKISLLLAQVWKHLDDINFEKKRVTMFKGTPWETTREMTRKEAAALGIFEEILQDVFGGLGDKLRSKAAEKNGWFKNKIHTSPRF